MLTTAAYAGAIFTLVLGLGCLVGAVAAAIAGMWGITVAAGGITAICAAMIIMNDWPKLWKPMLFPGQG